MAREQVKLVAVDTASLTQGQQSAWDVYLQAKRALGEALQTSAPSGKRIIFSAKYNVLKIGLVGKASEKSDKPAVSIADWLADKDANGEAR